MPSGKREHPRIKSQLHPRNKHRERYDFKQLISVYPELSHHVKLNDYQDESIDFFNPAAVKMLNKALLAHFYGITFWDIPQNYLCPPIPGRADYIHYAADLLSSKNNGNIPSGEKINCLDVGVGANCVYPIIGNSEYGWSFVGSEIDAVAVRSAMQIVEQNSQLKGKIEIRLQKTPKNIFSGIIRKDDIFDLTLCNPPFHSSLAEAQAGTLRKLSNLKNRKVTTPTLNFGGQNTELWCDGGEEKFIQEMVSQSTEFAESCFWFTTLVSKEASLKSIYEAIRNGKAVEMKTVEMRQGNKVNRLVAWTFLSPEQQVNWARKRWYR